MPPFSPHRHTMKPWQLLVFLLLSDLSPPSDGDRIMDYFKWRLCRKGRLKVAVQTACLKSEYKTPKAQGQNLQDTILRIVASALAQSGSPEEEKLVPVVRVVSETRHMSVNVIRKRSKSAWSHRHFTASGLQESRSRLPVAAAHPCLTGRCSEAKVASCCPHNDEMRSAAQEEARPRAGAADAEKRLNDHRQRPVLSSHDAVRDAQLHAGLLSETNAHLNGRQDFSSPLEPSSGEEGRSDLKQLLLVSRKIRGSDNRQDDNEYFTKESWPKVFRQDGKPAKSPSKTAENERSWSSAYSIRTHRLKHPTSGGLMEIFLQETEIQLEGLLDFPPMTDFLPGPEKSECRCSDGGEHSEKEIIKSANETLDSSSVSNYTEDKSAPPTTPQPQISKRTTETTTTKILQTTATVEETSSSEVSARLDTARTTTLLSGLRMKDNVPSTLKDESDESRTSTSRHDQKTEPPKPVNMTQNESLHPEAERVPLPLCGGLIARSEAGRKHCMERLGIPASRRFSSTETPDVRGRKEASDPGSDDGNHHFYYYDGVMKKVPVSSDPLSRRQRLRRSRTENIE